jgi:hypothetical protein
MKNTDEDKTKLKILDLHELAYIEQVLSINEKSIRGQGVEGQILRNLWLMYCSL